MFALKIFMIILEREKLLQYRTHYLVETIVFQGIIWLKGK